MLQSFFFLSVLFRWILALSLCFMRMCHAALRQDIGFALVCMSSIAIEHDHFQSGKNITSGMRSGNGTKNTFPLPADSRSVVVASEVSKLPLSLILRTCQVQRRHLSLCLFVSPWHRVKRVFGVLIGL